MRTVSNRLFALISFPTVAIDLITMEMVKSTIQVIAVVIQRTTTVKYLMTQIVPALMVKNTLLSAAME